jgi:hypothetical protein
VFSVNEYGINVAQFIQDHRNYIIRAGFEGFGYSAQRRGPNGRGTGERIERLTLDELAAVLKEAETSEPSPSTS